MPVQVFGILIIPQVSEDAARSVFFDDSGRNLAHG